MNVAEEAAKTPDDHETDRLAPQATVNGGQQPAWLEDGEMTADTTCVPYQNGHGQENCPRAVEPQLVDEIREGMLAKLGEPGFVEEIVSSASKFVAENPFISANEKAAAQAADQSRNGLNDTESRDQPVDDSELSHNCSTLSATNIDMNLDIQLKLSMSYSKETECSHDVTDVESSSNVEKNSMELESPQGNVENDLPNSSSSEDESEDDKEPVSEDVLQVEKQANNSNSAEDIKVLTEPVGAPGDEKTACHDSVSQITLEVEEEDNKELVSEDVRHEVETGNDDKPSVTLEAEDGKVSPMSENEALQMDNTRFQENELSPAHEGLLDLSNNDTSAFREVLTADPRGEPQDFQEPVVDSQNSVNEDSYRADTDELQVTGLSGPELQQTTAPQSEVEANQVETSETDFCGRETLSCDEDYTDRAEPAYDYQLTQDNCLGVRKESLDLQVDPCLDGKLALDRTGEVSAPPEIEYHYKVSPDSCDEPSNVFEEKLIDHAESFQAEDSRPDTANKFEREEEEVPSASFASHMVTASVAEPQAFQGTVELSREDSSEDECERDTQAETVNDEVATSFGHLHSGGDEKAADDQQKVEAGADMEEAGMQLQEEKTIPLVEAQDMAATSDNDCETQEGITYESQNNQDVLSPESLATIRGDTDIVTGAKNDTTALETNIGLSVDQHEKRDTSSESESSDEESLDSVSIPHSPKEEQKDDLAFTVDENVPANVESSAEPRMLDFDAEEAECIDEVKAADVEALSTSDPTDNGAHLLVSEEDAFNAPSKLEQAEHDNESTPFHTNTDFCSDNNTEGGLQHQNEQENEQEALRVNDEFDKLTDNQNAIEEAKSDDVVAAQECINDQVEASNDKPFENQESERDAFEKENISAIESEQKLSANNGHIDDTPLMEQAGLPSDSTEIVQNEEEALVSETKVSENFCSEQTNEVLNQVSDVTEDFKMEEEISSYQQSEKTLTHFEESSDLVVINEHKVEVEESLLIHHSMEEKKVSSFSFDEKHLEASKEVVESHEATEVMYSLQSSDQASQLLTDGLTNGHHEDVESEAPSHLLSSELKDTALVEDEESLLKENEQPSTHNSQEKPEDEPSGPTVDSSVEIVKPEEEGVMSQTETVEKEGKLSAEEMGGLEEKLINNVEDNLHTTTEELNGFMEKGKLPLINIAKNLDGSMETLSSPVPDCLEEEAVKAAAPSAAAGKTADNIKAAAAKSASQTKPAANSSKSTVNTSRASKEPLEKKKTPATGVKKDVGANKTLRASAPGSRPAATTSPRATATSKVTPSRAPVSTRTPASASKTTASPAGKTAPRPRPASSLASKPTTPRTPASSAARAPASATKQLASAARTAPRTQSPRPSNPTRTTASRLNGSKADDKKPGVSKAGTEPAKLSAARQSTLKNTNGPSRPVPAASSGPARRPAPRTGASNPAPSTTAPRRPVSGTAAKSSAAAAPRGASTRPGSAPTGPRPGTRPLSQATTRPQPTPARSGTTTRAAPPAAKPRLAKNLPASPRTPAAGLKAKTAATKAGDAKTKQKPAAAKVENGCSSPVNGVNGINGDTLQNGNSSINGHLDSHMNGEMAKEEAVST